MESTKKSFTHSRNIFQTTQANINTPRNLFAARQQSYGSPYLPSDSISWESSYLDPGCINNYQLSWYGSKYGVNLGGAGNNFLEHGNSIGGGFLCSGMNDSSMTSMSTEVTCTTGRGVPSINNPINSNSPLNTTESLMFNNSSSNNNNNGFPNVQMNINDDSMETDGYTGYPTASMNNNNSLYPGYSLNNIDNNNALDITPSISADLQHSMNSFEMITELKNGVDQLTDVNDPNDILFKLNSRYTDKRDNNSSPPNLHQNDENFTMMNEDIDMHYNNNDSSQNPCCNFGRITKEEELIKKEIEKINNEEDTMNDICFDNGFMDDDFNIPSIQWTPNEDDDNLDLDPPEEIELNFTLPSPQKPSSTQQSIILKERNTTLEKIVDPQTNRYKSAVIKNIEVNNSDDNNSVGNNTILQKQQQPPPPPTSQESEPTDAEYENVGEYFDENGDTVLHVAIHRQNINQALEILQKPEASVIKNLRNNSKEVPILLVLKRFAERSASLLDKLLELGANVNAQDQNGNNIFHLILLQTRSEENCLPLLNILSKHEKYNESYKMLMNKRNVDGFCVSHIATVRRYNKVVSLLRNKGADFDIQDHKGQRTCIVMAAEERNWTLVKEFLDMNVDVNIATNANIRAVNYAIKYEEIEMIELLFKHRTDVYKWKERTTPKEIVQLVEKLIRKKRRQRQKKETQVERPA